MNQSQLERRTIRTWLGALSYWALPEAADGPRPVVVVLMDSAGTLNQLNRLPALLADACHAVIAELPLRPPEAPPATKLEHLAGVLGEAIHTAFRGRPVILLAIGDSAAVAAIANAPEIVRMLLVEPLLRTAGVEPAVRDAVRARTNGRTDRGELAFLLETWGVAPSEPAVDRIHLGAIAGVRRPLDVLVGGRLPGSGPGASWVDAEARAWLEARANTYVQVAPAAGHALLREAGGLVVSGIRGALAWARGLARPAEQLARGFAAACPRDAVRVLYLGGGADTFRGAYEAVNPTARIADEPSASGPFDLVAVQAATADAVDVAALAGRIADGGVLAVLLPLSESGPELEARVSAAGFTLAPPAPELTPLGALMVRGVRAGSPPVKVDVIAYAQRMMDIRTHLPANALRTCASMDVHYGAPPFVQPLAPASPRVVVMQRPAAWSTDTWAVVMARAILARQVIVIEIDDHPELISQIVRGRSADAHEWDRFRMAHAIQTSTEPLHSVFSAHNPEVRVWPNAVFELAPFPAGPRPKRVFYGGVTRGPFAVEVARALAPAAAKHPDATFHVVGDRGLFEALPTANKQFSDYLPFHTYLEAMAACSISLSPLEDRPYVETKSDAKYLDASRAGLLTIASPVVYARTIESGRNGLIATTLDDWPRMLDLALSDDAARERMARAAWEDVRDHRMFGGQIAARRDWYAGLLARQDELDRAVLARSPAVAAELDKLKVRAGLK